jgi:quinoprotein glucose dehydrogenase
MRVLLVSALLIPAALIAQSTKTPPADWPMFNRDLAGTRYSPLAQITAANVATLKQVWSYRL